MTNEVKDCLLIEDWIDSRTTKVAGHRVKFGDLYADYQAFLIARGLKNSLWQTCKRVFSVALVSRGYTRHKAMSTRYIVGLALRNSEP